MREHQAWKELESQEDVVMQKTHGSLYREPLTLASKATIVTFNLDKPISIRTGQSWSTNIPHLAHDVQVCLVYLFNNFTIITKITIK